MNKKITVMAILLGVVPAAVFGYFEDVGRDARSRGMGNAVISLYNGVHSIHYNPAGILRTGSMDLNLQWGKPLTMTELSDKKSFQNLYAGYVMPFGDMAASLSFEHQDNAGLVKESLITTGFAMALDNMLPGATLGAGVNLKLFMLGFEETDDWSSLPDSPDSSTLAFGADLGVVYNFSDNIQIGAVAENIIPPNFSVFEGGTDRSPMNIKLGASLALRDIGPMEILTLAGNYVRYGKYDPEDNTVAQTSWHFGFETWMVDRMFGVRSGLVFGDDEYREFSFGLSFQLVMADNIILVDYAFTLPWEMSTLRHLIGLTWKLNMGSSVTARSASEAARRRR